MKLILEKPEIVAIISKHFELSLDPNSVVVRTEPLEIELTGIPLTEAAMPERVVSVAVPRAPVAAESGTAAQTLADIVAMSKQLEGESGEKPADFYARRRGGVQSAVPPREDEP